VSYEVEYLTLKRAGSKAVGLAVDIEDLLTDMHMDDVEGAIPGGISGGVATSVSNDWKEASKTASSAQGLRRQADRNRRRLSKD